MTKNNMTYFSLSLPRRLKWRAEAALLGAGTTRKQHFDIIVTTYIARFDTYFKGLIFQLSRLFSDLTIFVVVNGHYDWQQQSVYLDRLHRFALKFPTVRLIIFDEPTGLSSMWNRAIAATRSDSVMILNDDLYLSSRFGREIQKSLLLNSAIALINDSWSHFLIKRSIFEEVGPFDESFCEIGYEDRDYEIRLARAGITIENFEVAGIVNCVEQPDVYSYGKEISISDGKYCSSNRDFFYRKWFLSSEESVGAVYVPRLAKWVTPSTDTIYIKPAIK